MDSRKAILRRQRKWAQAAGIGCDAKGYVTTIDDNLRVAFSPATLADFDNGGGAELRPRSGALPKMQALHSSAALVANVFEHWRHANATPLLQGLGIDASLKALSFEKSLPTGLEGTPPNVDVALELTSGSIVGIECKFTEWLTPKRGSKPAFKEKYFAGGIDRWSAVGLPECQRLATALMQREERFRFLDAAQLLKHALGLATQYPGRFSLHYVFYDIAGRISQEHRSELARFASRVGGELAFKVTTYQTLFQAWRARSDLDADYLRYLGKRYFHSD